MDLTKRSLRDALATNDAGLAKFFNVTPSAVSQWADNEPLPPARQWQVKALRPDLVADKATSSAQNEGLADTRMSKRALRARLGLSTDAHLAKVLQLPVEQVVAWPEELGVPALPQVMRILGVEPEQPPGEGAQNDPDAERVIQVQVA